MAVNAVKIGDYLEEEEFYPNTDGEISESITQNWTEQAVECYKLKCDCTRCSISKGHYSFACQMPKILDVLVKTLGKPNAKSMLKVVENGVVE